MVVVAIGNQRTEVCELPDTAAEVQTLLITDPVSQSYHQILIINFWGRIQKKNTFCNMLQGDSTVAI